MRRARCFPSGFTHADADIAELVLHRQCTWRLTCGLVSGVVSPAHRVTSGSSSPRALAVLVSANSFSFTKAFGYFGIRDCLELIVSPSCLVVL